MDVYAKIFMELSRYVPYLKDEKARVQCFLSGLPQSYQDQINFDKTNRLEDTFQKAKCFYDQSNHKQEPPKDWKMKEKHGFQKKEFKYFSYKNSRKGAQLGQPSTSVDQ